MGMHANQEIRNDFALISLSGGDLVDATVIFGLIITASSDWTVKKKVG